MKVQIGQEMFCYRCGHEWYTRCEDVRSCPKCRSAYFDRPKNRQKLVNKRINKKTKQTKVRLIKEEPKKERKLLVKKPVVKKQIFVRRLLGGK